MDGRRRMMMSAVGGKKVNRITVAFQDYIEIFGNVYDIYSAVAQYPVASDLTVTITGVDFLGQSGGSNAIISQGNTKGGNITVFHGLMERSVSVEPIEDDTYIYELEHPF